ncbi:MAG: NAD(P)/FAD-dependent oxidoreductase [Cryobacterium sp.]|nr:NAD(P)/FAD-dependent oxidoreductase [Oligoflexia bacterium]
MSISPPTPIKATKRYDAVVVGSGPNGFAAAITVAERGGSVLLLEGSESLGGGMRTKELNLPGFHHDVCSTAHPLGVSSPFFRKLPLADHGLEWIFAPSELAHPLDDGSAVMLERSLDKTAAGLGVDGDIYREIMSPLLEHGDSLLEEILQPILHLPKHPLLLAQFGLKALRSADGFARAKFQGERARAIFGGIAAHSMIPLSHSGSSAIALVLSMAGHLRGWPVAKGGSGSITQALRSYLISLGGEIQTGRYVKSLRELPASRWTFLDITPKAFSEIAANELSESQKRSLIKFRYGGGVFKMDFALSDSVPWTAKECLRAATVHLGGRLDEIAASERTAYEGRTPEKPYVLAVQSSLFDPSRAPEGKHTLWAYCHVPSGENTSQEAVIENQIERFAPGFKSKILAKSSLTPADFERYNPNYVGGDISGGAMSLKQTLFRPKASFSPYATALPGVFLCSSSTPPGPGVHGMAGYHAALAALGN